MATFKEVNGGFFNIVDDANNAIDGIVNLVNAEGNCTTGLAMHCRYRYPSMYAAYNKRCKQGRVHPGECNIHYAGQNKEKPLIFNMVTTQEENGETKKEWIDQSFKLLASSVRLFKPKRVLIPAIVGNNDTELSQDVDKAMHEHLDKLQDTEFWLVKN